MGREHEFIEEMAAAAIEARDSGDNKAYSHYTRNAVAEGPGTSKENTAAVLEALRRGRD